MSTRIPESLRTQTDAADRGSCCYCLTSEAVSGIPLTYDRAPQAVHAVARGHSPHAGLARREHDQLGTPPVEAGDLPGGHDAVRALVCTRHRKAGQIACIERIVGRGCDTMTDGGRNSPSRLPGWVDERRDGGNETALPRSRRFDGEALEPAMCYRELGGDVLRS
jgi:hypothetical protein